MKKIMLSLFFLISSQISANNTEKELQEYMDKQASITLDNEITHLKDCSSSGSPSYRANCIKRMEILLMLAQNPELLIPKDNIGYLSDFFAASDTKDYYILLPTFRKALTKKFQEKD